MNDEITLTEYLSIINKKILNIIDFTDKNYYDLNKRQNKTIQDLKNIKNQINRLINVQIGGKKIKKRTPKKDLISIANNLNIKNPEYFSSSKKLKESIHYVLMCKMIFINDSNKLNKNNYITLCNLIGYIPNNNIKKNEMIDFLDKVL